MKSVLVLAFLVIAAIGCDTPESSSGSDTSPAIGSDSMMSTPGTTDTVETTPVDTTGSLPLEQQK